MLISSLISLNETIYVINREKWMESRGENELPDQQSHFLFPPN